MTSALFQLARFQVRAAALTAGPAALLDDAYVFAWDVGIFPIFHDDGLHLSFREGFAASSDMMNGLMSRLDEHWLAQSPPTFNALEREMAARDAADPWPRDMLIHAVRYAFLMNRFDDRLYTGLLKPGDHPTEAGEIMSSYDRELEIRLS